MEFSTEELTEAKRQIDSILHKLRAAVSTLQKKEQPEQYRSQITLAQRRIRALEAAINLIKRELERLSGGADA